MFFRTKKSLGIFFFTFTPSKIKFTSMKQLFIVLFFVAITVQGIAQEQGVYQRVKISLTNKEVSLLAQTGIDITEGIYKAGHSLQTDLSLDEVEKVKAAGFEVSVVIDDVAAFYVERAAAEASIEIQRSAADEFPVPANWSYGNMAGYYTYDQVMERLDFMAATWPDLVSVKQPINPDLPSHNGNPVYYVKISDNVNEAENEPQVLYTSLIHAREVISYQQMIYFMFYLLENYETDARVQAIVNNRELYFIPIINPDGYLYNIQTNPNGGGMWRKNRRNNGGSFGVDLNRNYGYKWGLDNNGSSPYPTDETYRGPSAFSEPETNNIRQFAENHNFQIALNYHSYSNLLLYPWGYTDVPCPDDAIFSAHSKLMTRDNNYVYGPGSSTIYPTNGGSDDYFYGDTQAKNAVFAYTPEVGSAGDGFWPAVSRIIPLCQENMIQNIRAAQLAGNYGELTDASEKIIGQRDFYLPFQLQRLGFGDAEGWTVSIVPLDDKIMSHGDEVSFGFLPMLATVQDSIQITLSPSIQSGDFFRFLLQLNNGESVVSDTITKIFGTTTSLLDDPCNQLANWTSTNWAITSSSYVSAPSSITDSPSGNYGNNTNRSITLTQPLAIPETPYAHLSFWAKWDIEAGWDYVQLLIKPANGLNWTPLAGKYTKAGGSNQLLGQPLYDGTMDWVKEEIDLTAYAGTSIQLRFILTSDGGVTADGFYFDDVKVMVLDVETGLNESSLTRKSFSLTPNPAQNQVTLEAGQPFAIGEKLSILDAQGKVLKIQHIDQFTNRVEISLQGLAPGLYFVQSLNYNIAKLIVRP